jgi:hypothetical protein
MSDSFREPTTIVGRTSSSTEHQLGEIVGTLRMTVTAVENLRVTVERLANTAVLKVDLDGHRAMIRDEIATRLQASSERETRLLKQLEELQAKVGSVQRWMWMLMGGGTTLMLLSRLVSIPVKLTIGG